MDVAAVHRRPSKMHCDGVILSCMSFRYTKENARAAGVVFEWEGTDQECFRSPQLLEQLEEAMILDISSCCSYDVYVYVRMPSRLQLALEDAALLAAVQILLKWSGHLASEDNSRNIIASLHALPDGVLQLPEPMQVGP